VTAICRKNPTVWSDRLGDSSGGHESSEAQNECNKDALHGVPLKLDRSNNSFLGRATTLPAGTRKTKLIDRDFNKHQKAPPSIL
jgi:hypothetical protein